MLSDIVGNMSEFITENHPEECGIVYASTRKEVEMLVEELQSLGHSAASYHAGLKTSDRKEVQKNWLDGKIKIMVATIAFGMGVDKSDVRFVIHHSLPKSLEGFYQESGRAGRDRLSSTSLLYYSVNDRERQEFLIRASANSSKHSTLETERRMQAQYDQLRSVAGFAESAQCRRTYILRYFGEDVVSGDALCKRTCDFCQNPHNVTKMIECYCSSSNSSSHLFVKRSSKIYGAVDNIVDDDEPTIIELDEIGDFSDQEDDEVKRVSDRFTARLIRQQQKRFGMTHTTQLSSKPPMKRSKTSLQPPVVASTSRDDFDSMFDSLASEERRESRSLQRTSTFDRLKRRLESSQPGFITASRMMSPTSASNTGRKSGILGKRTQDSTIHGNGPVSKKSVRIQVHDVPDRFFHFLLALTTSQPLFSSTMKNAK